MNPTIHNQTFAKQPHPAFKNKALQFAGYFDKFKPESEVTPVEDDAVTLSATEDSAPDVSQSGVPHHEVAYAAENMRASLQPPSKWKREHRKFWDAIKDGNGQQVRDYISSKGPNIIEPESRNSALMYAIMTDRYDLFSDMLMMNAEVNHHNNRGHNALYLAMIDGKHKFAKSILQTGRVAKESLKTPDGISFLNFALQNTDYELAQLLVQAGADVNEVIDHKTLLKSAILDTKPERARFLIEAGADPNIADSNGNNALHVAAYNNQTELLTLMAKANGNINAKNKIGETPLMLAGVKGNKTFNTLLNLDASISEKNNYGQNIVHIVVEQALPEFLNQVIQKASANKNLLSTMINQPDMNGDTPLIVAANDKSANALEVLLKNGANITAVNDQGYSFIDAFFATESNAQFKHIKQISTDKVSHFINQLSNVKNKEALQQLLNTPLASSGKLPLDVILEHHPGSIFELLQMGANPLSKNNAGLNAFDTLATLLENSSITTDYQMVLKALMAAVPTEEQGNVWSQTVPSINQGTLFYQYIVNTPLENIRHDLPGILETQPNILLTDKNGNNVIDNMFSILQDLTGADQKVIINTIITPLLDYLSETEQKDLLNRTDLTQFNLNALLNKPSMPAFLIKNYMEMGADITTFDRSGRPVLTTLITRAILNEGFTPLLEETLASLESKDVESMINIMDHNGQFPLMNTVNFLNTPNGKKIASLLMQYGADAGRKNNEGLDFQGLFKKSYNTPLSHLLAGQGENELLQQFIDSNLYLDEQDSFGNTVVKMAVEGNNLETLKLLIKNNADVNKPDNQGTTPLMMAALNGNVEIFKTLLEAGANLEHKNNAMQNILHLLVTDISTNTASSSLEEKEEILNLIFSKQINLESKDAKDRSALHIAVDNNDAHLINMLLNAGADIEASTGEKKDYTPLLLAVTRGHKDSILALLKAGANPNAELFNGTGLIETLIRSNHVFDTLEPEFLNAVLKTEGIDVNIANSQGLTPLIQAVLTGNAEAAAILINHGADLKKEAQNGATIEKIMQVQGPKVPLPFWLYKTNNRHLFETFLKAGADFNNVYGIQTLLRQLITDGDATSLETLFNNGVNFPDNEKQNPSVLHIAFAQNNEQAEQIALLMLKNNINPKLLQTPLSNGNSLLMEATAKGWSTVVDVLLQDAENINTAHSKTGQTPLMQAVLSGDKSTVESLITAGANINITDKKDYSALSYAVESNAYDIAELILKHKPRKATQLLSNNKTILAHSLQNKQYTFAQKLIDTKAENFSETNGNVAMAQSISAYDPIAVKLLLDNGVDVSQGHYSDFAKPVSVFFNTLLVASSGEELKQLDEIGGMLFSEERINAEKLNALQPPAMKGKNALNEAMTRGMDKTVQALLTLKVGLQDKIDGKTLVMLAAENGNINSLKMLLGHDENINTPSDNGKTALHLAVENNQVEAVKMLVDQKGINLEAKNTQGMTAFISAVLTKNKEMISLLANAGADTTTTVDNGKDVIPPLFLALHDANKRNKVDYPFLQTLIDSGVDINQPSGRGVTPLILAARSLQIDLIKLFIENGADKHQVIQNANERYTTVYEFLMYAMQRHAPKNHKDILALFDINLQELKSIVTSILMAKKENKEIDPEFLDTLVQQVKTGKDTALLIKEQKIKAETPLVNSKPDVLDKKIVSPNDEDLQNTLNKLSSSIIKNTSEQD